MTRPEFVNRAGQALFPGPDNIVRPANFGVRVKCQSQPTYFVGVSLPVFEAEILIPLIVHVSKSGFNSREVFS